MVWLERRSGVSQARTLPGMTGLHLDARTGLSFRRIMPAAIWRTLILREETEG